MKGLKILIAAGVITVGTIAYMIGEQKTDDVLTYTETVKDLTIIHNDVEQLKVQYQNDKEVLRQKGVVADLETVEAFVSSIGDLSVVEVDLLKYIDNNMELVASMPTLYDAFSVKNCDMINVTFSVSCEVSEILERLSSTEIIYKEIKVFPTENKIQMTFLL